MREVRQFATDMVCTIVYFAYTPLQYLFWRMPRVYDATVSSILFFKYLLPSKIEILYTWIHWQIVGLGFAATISNTLAKLFIIFSKYTNQTRRKKLSEFQHLGRSIDWKH